MENFFKKGRCTRCASKDCNDLCPHYGAVVCMFTLREVGERLYMKGFDELGIKYYAMAELAKHNQHIPETTKHVLPPRRSVRPTKKGFESIQVRYNKKEGIRWQIENVDAALGLRSAPPRPINGLAAKVIYGKSGADKLAMCMRAKYDWMY